MTTYTFLKYVHVVLAIVAIGFNASYAIWLRQIPREPALAAPILRGIKTLDDRFANPAYGLLLVTGIAMVFVGDIPFSTFWIAGGLVLYAVVVLGGALVYSPILRRQTALVEGGRVDSEEYRGLAQRGTVVGAGLLVLVLIIEFLMVTKPTL